MMKKLALILVFLFMQQLLAAQSLVDTPRITTATSMNLAGKIDSVAESTLAVKILDVGSSLHINSDSGSTIITVPDTSYAILEERAWKFDKEGRLLSEIFRSADNRRGELQELDAHLYAYKKGNIYYVLTRRDGAKIDSSAYIYSQGKISMIEHYDGKHKYAGRKQFFQNKDRVLSTISNKNADLELIDMTKLWYSENGELREATFHDQNQRWVLTKKYEADTDSAGHKHVKIFEFAKPDTCTGMVSYLLDDAGNHLEDVSQDDRGMVTSYSTSVFNDYNHCTSQVIFTGAKLQVTITYRYDEHQNWIMKRIYHDGQPATFVRRTIYYREE